MAGSSPGYFSKVRNRRRFRPLRRRAEQPAAAPGRARVPLQARAQERDDPRDHARDHHDPLPLRRLAAAREV